MVAYAYKTTYVSGTKEVLKLSGSPTKIMTNYWEDDTPEWVAVEIKKYLQENDK